METQKAQHQESQPSPMQHDLTFRTQYLLLNLSKNQMQHQSKHHINREEETEQQVISKGYRSASMRAIRPAMEEAPHLQGLPQMAVPNPKKSEESLLPKPNVCPLISLKEF